MDIDFWAARIHSAKHLPTPPTAQSTKLISSSGNYHVVMEDEEDDEVRAWFPCPFCYMEIELSLLCVHLQEEHCFDLKNAVCPICAANLGKDALGHFSVQHIHSIKRRKQSQKSGFWSNISTNMVKDFRELSSFLGTNSLSSGNEAAPDPLLSPFVCTMPKDSHRDASQVVAPKNDAERVAVGSTQEEVQDHKERRQKATFVQELLVSTIFLEDF